MSRLKDFGLRHLWFIVGAVITAFLLASLAHIRIPGQFCLLVSVGCSSVAQVDRYRSAGNQREAILGLLAVILAVAGLILVWPSQAHYLLMRVCEGAAAISN